MKWICYKGITVAVLSTVATLSFSSPNFKIIYGLDNAQHFQSKNTDDFYIQMGSFSNKSNASNFQKTLGVKTNYPMVLLQKNGHYKVTIGPVHSAEQVRSIGRLFNTIPLVTTKVTQPILAKPLPIKQIVRKPKSVPTRIHYPTQKLQKKSRPTFFLASIQSQGNWFVSGAVGAQFPKFQSNMTVNNGSGFPTPYNEDQYSTNTNSDVILGAGVGRRWYRDRLWLPAFSLGASYQHFFAGNIGGTVMQNSLPDFTNYTYFWRISSNVLLATAKLNLLQYKRVSPFINAGIGGSFNNASGYSEAALSGVTPRISPYFTSKTNGNFSYNLGTGLDFKVAPQMILSLAYLYQDLGNVSSGFGTQAWSNQSLSLGSYRTNNVFISVHYLFNR